MSPGLLFLKPAAIIFTGLPLLVFLAVLVAFPVSAQQLDTTFGTGGVTFAVPPDFSSAPGGVAAFAIRGVVKPDGSIAVLTFAERGFPKSPPSLNLFQANLTGNGTGLTWSPRYSGITPVDGAQQPDGKIAALWNSGSNMVIGRLELNGNLGMTVTFDVNSNTEQGKNILVQPDGKILVAGTTSNFDEIVTVVARFNSNGALDTTFGSNGTGYVLLYDNGILSEKMVLKSDGKILLAGKYYDNPPLSNETVSMLFQLNPSGSPDPSFGENGLAYLFDSGQLVFADMKAQPDGSAVLLSTRTYIPDGTRNYKEQDVVLTKISADGSIDAAFGENGRAITNISPPTDSPTSYDPFDVHGDEGAGLILLESSGNIVVAMSARLIVPFRAGLSGVFPGQLARRTVLLLRRYNPGGQLIAKNFSGQTGYADCIAPAPELTGILEQPDHKILIFGALNPGHFTSGFCCSYDQVLVARFSSIASVNNANNFFDYNLDGKADFPTYHPNPGGYSKWKVYRTAVAGSIPYQEMSWEFGLSGDVPVPGDYDGDSVQDLAVFRNDTGDWFTRKNYLNNCGPMDCTAQIHFGLAGDVPAPGDFDGDGTTDRAVFRPSEGNWYILFSSGGWTGLHFGQNGDLPVTGDYDDDGKSDVAVARRENGRITWYVLQSSDNQFVGIQFGLDSDKAVPADYTGDGKTDICVWRPSDGNWYILSNYVDFSYLHWGQAGDIPEPADYDSDGKTDVTVFRPSDRGHYARGSRLGNGIGLQDSLTGGIPVASAYVR
jgi:uncharacterized delta-60 repeat protein